MAGKFNPRSDIGILRSYVVGGEGPNLAETTVMVNITHSHLRANFPEIRLDLHMTIEAVKRKIGFHCGTNSGSIVLQLKDEDGRLLAVLSDDQKKLGFYSPRTGCTLHVIETDATALSVGGWLEDTSKVEKYMMSDEDYAQRDNTYRKFKEQKLKEDPEWTLEKEVCKRTGKEYKAAPKPVDQDYQEAEASGLHVGERCRVEPGARLGEIKYVGRVEGLSAGFWAGVHYDEPQGRNDGAAHGKRYFQCPPNYGAFVRPDKVTVGDFPTVDEFSDLEEGDEI